MSLLKVKLSLMFQQGQYEGCIALWRDNFHPTGERLIEIFVRAGDLDSANSTHVDIYYSYDQVLSFFRARKDHDGGLAVCALADKTLT